MKIRLLSDLHIDVNEDYGVNLGDNDVFTLIAGDICGKVDGTVDWLRKNVKKGAFCAGNHIVYDPEAVDSNAKIVPIEDLKKKLHKEFPLESDITFFDYDVKVMQKEIGENLLLVSDVMYTDYRLPVPGVNPKGDPGRNMRLAEPKFSGSYLNDFRFGYTRKKMYEKDYRADGTSIDGTPNGIWHLKAKYYKDHHEMAWKRTTEIVEANPDKEIILMTHHCLSPKCISQEYVNDTLNASYVSDKNEWILAHPNVKLILSGHVHHRTNFKVGETLYVLNPLGYCYDTAKQFNPETKKMEMWTPHCFIDTDTWELTYEPYENEKWDERLDIHNHRLASLAKFFI